MGLPKIRAPELPENLEWFNIDRPLTIAEQLGKLVLLDFWTYCCINCMHVLPDLRYLEEKYPDSLTVIGLHSPKFTNERVGDQVQKAINRYSIQHPVANDPGLTVWRQYGVHAWPTLVLIDTEGNVVAVLPGEGNRQRLDQLIAQQIEIAKQNGTYQPRRLSAKMSPETSTSKLLFPGKLFIDKEKLYVSDSGHQRVLELDPQGKVLRSFGTEAVAKVRFNNPQGLIKVGQILYVADTDNHCIRSIDLVSGEVATLAGNGKQGGYLNSFQPVSLQTSLNSPWDLACVNNILFIAMAGSHQIWCVDLALQVLRLFAGSGHENIVDGTPGQAAFAQPSGLSLDDAKVLYVADSEVSGVRSIDLSSGQVGTLVGEGLFEYGDLAGAAQYARLQHPLGVCYDANGNQLWVADTYNHKIKRINLKSHEIYDFKIDTTLNEPSDVKILDKNLWVVDTNNHRILKIDIESGKSSVLAIS